MTDTPDPKPPADVEGGDKDVATDVQPPSAAPAEPNRQGGMLSNGTPDSRGADDGGRQGGMGGEG
jgi:hypothetical protein